MQIELFNACIQLIYFQKDFEINNTLFRIQTNLTLFDVHSYYKKKLLNNFYYLRLNSFFITPQ